MQMVENLIAECDGSTELVGGADGHYEQKLRIRHPMSEVCRIVVAQGNTQAEARETATLLGIHINEYGWLEERCKTLKNTADARDREIATLKSIMQTDDKNRRALEKELTETRLYLDIVVKIRNDALNKLAVLYSAKDEVERLRKKVREQSDMLWNYVQRSSYEEVCKTVYDLRAQLRTAQMEKAAEEKHTDLQDAYAKVGGRSEAALQGEIRRLQEELKVTRSSEAETSRQATQLATILNDANQEKKILREQLRTAREQKAAEEKRVVDLVKMLAKVREDVRVDRMAQAQQEQQQTHTNGQRIFAWPTWW
jgi:hypothetical protein